MAVCESCGQPYKTPNLSKDDTAAAGRVPSDFGLAGWPVSRLVCAFERVPERALLGWGRGSGSSGHRRVVGDEGSGLTRADVRGESDLQKRRQQMCEWWALIV